MPIRGKLGAPRTTTPRARRGMTRADKSAATRRKLIAAATQIVGLEGYANASVAKITTRARVAQGTFYNYFASQQDLFDQLLPEVGQQLLDYIRKRLGGCKDGLEREQIGFQAFFEFLHRTPEFYRILNEAETSSPKAFRDHMDNMTQGYLRSLRRSKQEGELGGYSEEELDVIVCILLAARNYISYHYIYRDGSNDPLPAWALKTYLKFITGGFTFGEVNARSRRQRLPASNAGSRISAPPRMESVSADNSSATLKAQISEAHRDLSGAVRRGIVLELIETAAMAVASGGGKRFPKLLNLTVGLLATTRAKTLVAAARCDQRADGVAHVSVRVTEDRRDGSVMATAQLLFAINGRAEQT